MLFFIFKGAFSIGTKSIKAAGLHLICGSLNAVSLSDGENVCGIIRCVFPSGPIASKAARIFAFCNLTRTKMAAARPLF
jgi:hypothetical protein